jgi:hypothetical protein
MMKHPLILLTLVISISLFFTSCETARPFYDNDEKQWSENTLPPASRLEFTVFLMGDAGEADLNPLEPNFRFLQSQLQEADENSAIVFLGDNIYPAGLVPEDHPERKQAEALLNAQLDLLKDFKGAPYFIPGNHDWNRMSAGGREAVQRQAKYIEDYLDNKKVYYPKDGCGDPQGYSTKRSPDPDPPGFSVVATRLGGRAGDEQRMRHQIQGRLRKGAQRNDRRKR